MGIHCNQLCDSFSTKQHETSQLIQRSEAVTLLHNPTKNKPNKTRKTVRKRTQTLFFRGPPRKTMAFLLVCTKKSTLKRPGPDPQKQMLALRLSVPARWAAARVDSVAGRRPRLAPRPKQRVKPRDCLPSLCPKVKT